MDKSLKVAIVHDDLVQWGGAERVLLAIADIFPDAPIYTSVFDSSNSLLQEKFRGRQIKTSFLQKIPFWRKLYKALFPLYPWAFEQFNFDEYDVVLSQTTRFAKAIITKPWTKHICYCHTPPRFLWNFSGERPSRVLDPILSYLRIEDKVYASRVDKFLAGSKNCQARISKIYRQKSEVSYPFVEDKFFASERAFNGGYYLMVGRLLNSYKRADMVVEAFCQNNKRLRVVGEGPEYNSLSKKATDRIEFLGWVSDEMIINLLAGCCGLIVAAEEDFGLTPLEAQAMGKGVIAYRAGGVLETVIEGKTGVFFGKRQARALNEAIGRFEKIKVDPAVCVENARRFDKKRFRAQLLGSL